MKLLCNHKVRDFAMALWARKVARAFEKWPPALHVRHLESWYGWGRGRGGKLPYEKVRVAHWKIEI